MISNKAEAALEWAKTWPEFGGYLKLNALITEDGEASLNVVPNDVSILEYIDGTKLREYTLQLKIITSWSDGYDEVNVEAERLAASWVDWVSEQYPGNVPDWPGASVQGIEPLENAPTLNYIYEDDALAEYVIQCVITYEE